MFPAAAQVKELLVTVELQRAEYYPPYPPGESTGYIYISSEGNGMDQPTSYYKIGSTLHLPTTIRDQQVGNPRPVYGHRHAIVSNMAAAEMAAQQAVAGYKVLMPGGGEWY